MFLLKISLVEICNNVKLL